MRWLLGFVLLLLALGTLRMVGCGDDGPECIYPFDYAAGTVRDPTCDDKNECTEGRCYYRNTCSNESVFRDGEPCDSGSVPDACSIDICVHGRCERTEKPCEGDWHEDCADFLKYDCDPDTGVVECTWDTDWFQGQTCCLDFGVCYGPEGSFGYCCKDSGWCIDGDCVTGNGYPPDCTDRDDGEPCDIGDPPESCWWGGEPCEIENTLGVCWKGNCAALDCRGLSSGTLCWWNEYRAGECRGELERGCYYARPSGGPPGWTCRAEYYGTGDGCDCGCGVIDLDCADGTVGSCDYCGLRGSCSSLWCPGDIDPAQNWICWG
jgi:hypothetical protein